MVSNSVHQELLQLADERVNDAELRTLQLENEVYKCNDFTLNQTRVFWSSLEKEGDKP